MKSDERRLWTDGTAGDTKAGTLIGTDKFGNKFYENMADELPRTISPNFTRGGSY